VFEDCLAVRELLQCYAPIVASGDPVHEGEAEMGRIEEQFEIEQALARQLAMNLAHYTFRGKDISLGEQADIEYEEWRRVVSSPASEPKT